MTTSTPEPPGLIGTGTSPGARRMRRVRTFRKAALPYLFIAPALIVLGVIMAFPMLRVFQMSLFQDLFSREGEQFVGLQNYRDIFQCLDVGIGIRASRATIAAESCSALFWPSLKNSLIFVSVSLVIHQVVGGGLALLLNEGGNTRFRSFARGVFILPWLIIPAVVAMIWVLLLDPRGGFNSTLRTLGIVECCPFPEWFSSFDLAMAALIVTNGWAGYPFTMLMWLAGLQSIRTDLYEAASVDGASRWQRFRHVTLPAMAPTIFTILLLDTIWTFRNWDLPWLTTGGGPGDTTMVLPLLTYREAFLGFRFGSSAAMAVMILLITGFFVFWYLRIRGRLLD